MRIVRHDGRDVDGERSGTAATGVFAAFDWRQLALDPIGPRLISKAAQNAATMLRHFQPQFHAQLTADLGHYSNLQSINSEDTVSGSVFESHDPKYWLNAMLDAAFGVAARPSAWRVGLWERTVHPDTGTTANGPEADVVLDAEGWRYVIEAKWLSDVEDGQGAGRNLTQLDLRAHHAAAGGAPQSQRGVIAIVPTPQRYLCKSRPVFSSYFEPDGSTYRALPRAVALGAQVVTWESIAGLLARSPTTANVKDYLLWRLSNI